MLSKGDTSHWGFRTFSLGGVTRIWLGFSNRKRNLQTDASIPYNRWYPMIPRIKSTNHPSFCIQYYSEFNTQSHLDSSPELCPSTIYHDFIRPSPAIHRVSSIIYTALNHFSSIIYTTPLNFEWCFPYDTHHFPSFSHISHHFLTIFHPFFPPKRVAGPLVRGARDFTEEAAAHRGASEALRAQRAALRSEAVELGKTCGEPVEISGWDGWPFIVDFPIKNGDFQ